VLQLQYKKKGSTGIDSVISLSTTPAKMLAARDSISNILARRGYLQILTDNIIPVNDSLYTSDLVLNKRYTHVLVQGDSLKDEKVLKLISLSRKRNYLPINEIETYVSRVNELLKQAGYTFAKTKLDHITFNTSDTIEARLSLSYQKKRYLDNIKVKGYEDFPIKTLQNFTAQRNTYNYKTLDRLEKNLKNMPFVKKTKESEVLFKKDSTTVFLYLEKLTTNLADGLIGFNNANDGKIEINGFVNLKLQNNLNRAETFLLSYRNDTGEQTQLSTSIDLPYIWNTAIGVNAQLELQRRDSTYQRTAVKAGLFYKPNWQRTLGLNYISTTSTATSARPDARDFSKNSIEVSVSLRRFTNDLLMPENLNLEAKIGYGRRAIDIATENQFNLNATLLKLWHLSSRSSFLSRLNACYLKSENIQFNELYQFGGLGSIRGFNQNSIDSSFYTTLATEYRYRLNDQIYLHSILDIGVFENFNSKNIEQLYGFGGGVAILTQAGILNLSVANGRFERANVDFSSTVAHINLKIVF
jgi:outer membrane protein assembly factor BamA